MTEALETYDVPGATRPIQDFVESCSPSGTCAARAAASGRASPDADKQAAYTTLYEALVTLSKLLAPTMPFLAEELYQKPGGLRMSPDAAESVHLADWPELQPRADRRRR